MNITDTLAEILGINKIDFDWQTITATKVIILIRCADPVNLVTYRNFKRVIELFNADDIKTVVEMPSIQTEPVHVRLHVLGVKPNIEDFVSRML